MEQNTRVIRSTGPVRRALSLNVRGRSRARARKTRRTKATGSARYGAASGVMYAYAMHLA
jgi:hypothetical protein